MISSWKNNLMNLPDSIFFDIMRNYLGDLKTPFNKHDLMRSLTSLISRKEIRNRILELIDQDDSRLLTAVAMLGASGIDELYEFTKQYYSFLELHNRIANLQERLLICIEENHRIRLNPVFEEELKAGYLDSSEFFSSLSVESCKPQLWLNEQLLAAFISFLSANKNILSSNALSRKKPEQRFSSVFQHTGNEPPGETADFLVRVLEKLGFIRTADSDFKINLKKIESFGTLSHGKRKLLLLAAAVTARTKGREVNIMTSYSFLAGLLNSLEPGTRLHENDLDSFFYLIRRRLLRSEQDAEGLNNQLLKESLCFTGALIKDGDFFQFTAPPVTAEPAAPAKMTVQSNFEITSPENFPLAGEISTALCCEITRHDIMRSYELKKSSFSEALNSGLSLERITGDLENFSTGGIPQNILFSLKAWEKEFRSISFSYGIVMVVSPYRLPLIEHSPILQQYILSSPAPGVFILDPDQEVKWRRAFAEAGFEMLPRTAKLHDEIVFERGFSTDNLPDSGFSIESYSGSITADSESIIEELSGKISSLRLPKDDKIKLEARARKKLILSETQLKASNKPEERGEAGGIDHRAKIRLAERALELDNLLEITTAKDFDLEKRLIKPQQLIKITDESPDTPPVYKIRGIELPDEQELTVAITKISYMRMLKSSLFTP